VTPRSGDASLERAVASVHTAAQAARVAHPRTPDGRYIVVRGRLWRCSDPRLSPVEHDRLTRELMAARRAKKEAIRTGDVAARELARARVDAAKVALGERGPVWWSDGAPDLTRHLARTGPYADWFAALPPDSET